MFHDGIWFEGRVLIAKLGHYPFESIRVRDEGAREASAVFERTIDAEPHVASRYFHAGLASKAAHDSGKAAQYLEEPSARDNRQLTDEKFGPLPRLDDHTGRLIWSLGAISLLC